jgi:hypothetical protein
VHRRARKHDHGAEFASVAIGGGEVAGERSGDLSPGTKFKFGISSQGPDGRSMTHVFEQMVGGNGMRLEDDFWFIAFGQKSIWLPQHAGLGYIRYLLERPGEFVPVAELVGAERVGAGGIASTASDQLNETSALESGLSIATLGDAGPASDILAREAYKKDLKRLARERKEAEARIDTSAIEKIDEETEAIKQQLGADFDHKGNPRVDGSVTERMRKRVLKHITTVLRQIRVKHPELADHLRQSLDTGARCRYRPAKEEGWRFAW